MSTVETLHAYFRTVEQKGDWPGRPAFESDMAELVVVTDGQIVSFDIYFDSAPFPK